MFIKKLEIRNESFNTLDGETEETKCYMHIQINEEEDEVLPVEIASSVYQQLTNIGLNYCLAE